MMSTATNPDNLGWYLEWNKSARRPHEHSLKEDWAKDVLSTEPCDNLHYMNTDLNTKAWLTHKCSERNTTTILNNLAERYWEREVKYNITPSPSLVWYSCNKSNWFFCLCYKSCIICGCVSVHAQFADWLVRLHAALLTGSLNQFNLASNSTQTVVLICLCVSAHCVSYG